MKGSPSSPHGDLGERSGSNSGGRSFISLARTPMGRPSEHAARNDEPAERLRAAGAARAIAWCLANRRRFTSLLLTMLLAVVLAGCYSDLPEDTTVVPADLSEVGTPPGGPAVEEPPAEEP